MTKSQRHRQFSFRSLAALALAGATIVPLAAQQPTAASNPALLPDRLWGQPQLGFDRGYAAFSQELAKLRTTARLMATAAHPDDEDGPMLALEARGLGVTALELTITRGEGGQNKTGEELFDELGILRTLELLQSDEYYSVEERFTRAADFGFSKSAQETFEKWGGHETALADFVRVIRTFRPDVIVSVFSGTANDGHGNHQASGILTREAFRAAGDPARFPEQIKEGLLPWQPKKLYIGRFRGGTDCSVTLNTGVYDPILGASYDQVGAEGRGTQISQVSTPLVLPGNRSRCYNLVDSALPGGARPAAKEAGLFDGIDTSLPGLVSRLGDESSKVPFLAPALDTLDAAAREAARFGPRELAQAAPILLGGARVLREAISQVEQAPLAAQAKSELLTHLRTKLDQFEKAAAHASGIELIAAVDSSRGDAGGFFRMDQTFLMAVPGQTFTLTAQMFNRSPVALDAATLGLELPPGWKAEPVEPAAPRASVPPNGSAAAKFRVTVPTDAEYTRPYFYRANPASDGVYRIVEGMERYVTLPFPPPPVIARAEYRLGELRGEVRSVAKVRFIDPIHGQGQRPLAVGPPLALELEPGAQVLSTARGGTAHVRVAVRNNVDGPAEGTLRLQAPQGWQVTPASLPVKFAENNEYSSYEFAVTPGRLREQQYEVKAVLDYRGKQYHEGYRVVARRDIGTFYYFHPARQVVSAVDVKLPPRLRVGYIMGAGDDIPAVLQQIGIDVRILSPAELASGDLSGYDTIVVGIRAYDVRTDVREQNRRLLDYVQRGGTLLVQYNQQAGQFNAGHYVPYPATMSGERVTLEEAPVQILEPASPLLNAPNKISARDFEGWVQERGLYFMNKWDPKYQPLLACNDPGEQPLQGGLLAAQYGKGTYIYTGYAFFRQLPAGVPGAIRLFVNLLSAGARQAR